MGVVEEEQVGRVRRRRGRNEDAERFSWGVALLAFVATTVSQTWQAGMRAGHDCRVVAYYLCERGVFVLAFPSAFRYCTSTM